MPFSTLFHLFRSCQLHQFTDKLLQQLYGEIIEQLHRWIYILSHAIRKREYGKQLKVLTGTNGEPKIRKQPINLSEMYENNNH